MSRALTFAALAALLPAVVPTRAAAQVPNAPAVKAPAKPAAGASRRVDIGGAVTPDASLRLSGQFASLRVVGWERDSVSLTGTVPAGARVDGGLGPGGDPGGKPARGGKFYVELPAGVTGGALELRVPARARLWVKAGVADVDARGLTGGLDVSVVGGSIAVSGSPRELRAEAMDGPVTVDGAPAWLRVKTASGDVTLRGGAGLTGDAAAESVSGALRVVGGRYERLRLENVVGGVAFAGALARGAALDIETHSGAVDLTTHGLDAELDVVSLTGTVGGEVRGQRLARAQPVVGRDGRAQEFGITVGDGSARVVVRTFKGAVRLLPDAPKKP